MGCSYEGCNAWPPSKAALFERPQKMRNAQCVECVNASARPLGPTEEPVGVQKSLKSLRVGKHQKIPRNTERNPDSKTSSGQGIFSRLRVLEGSCPSFSTVHDSAGGFFLVGKAQGIEPQAAAKQIR